MLLGGGGKQRKLVTVLRVAVVLGTFQLGWLLRPIGTTWFLAAVFTWATVCAVLATLGRGDPEAVSDTF